MRCGAWLKLSEEEMIEICWNGGKGTNNIAELMAIWCGLLAAVNLELNDVSIYGDSKLIIDTMNGKVSNSSITEHGWYRRARHLWERLNYPPISHIYRENNTRDDGLSKQGVGMVFGILRVSQYKHNKKVWTSDIPIP